MGVWGGGVEWTSMSFSLQISCQVWSNFKEQKSFLHLTCKFSITSHSRLLGFCLKLKMRQHHVREQDQSYLRAQQRKEPMLAQQRPVSWLHIHLLYTAYGYYMVVFFCSLIFSYIWCCVSSLESLFIIGCGLAVFAHMFQSRSNYFLFCFGVFLVLCFLYFPSRQFPVISVHLVYLLP